MRAGLPVAGGVTVPPLAERVLTTAPSATVELTERVRVARAAGREILGLSSGDPNLETHTDIIEAANRAMRAGLTHYGPAAGSPELRTAIAQRLSIRAGVAYDPAEILVTPGGKFAVFAACMAAVGPGDEVIVLDPAWVSYGPAVRLAGGTAVRVPALDIADPDLIGSAVTTRTRMIVINSPANPTGRIPGREELMALVALAERHDFWLLFDQVYADLTFERGAFTYLQALPGAKARCFVADSLSKTYGMTGWRIGYLAAPESAINAVLKVVQHTVYCVPGFLQAGAEAALALPEHVVDGYRAQFQRRRDRAAAVLDGLPGFRCPVPPASFYLFPRISGDDRAVAAEWLNELSIAVLPGSAFGQCGRGHLRLSLTPPDHQLEEALVRIERHYRG